MKKPSRQEFNGFYIFCTEFNYLRFGQNKIPMRLRTTEHLMKNPGHIRFFCMISKLKCFFVTKPSCQEFNACLYFLERIQLSTFWYQIFYDACTNDRAFDEIRMISEFKHDIKSIKSITQNLCCRTLQYLQVDTTFSTIGQPMTEQLNKC